MNSKSLSNVDDDTVELRLSDAKQEFIHSCWDRAHKNDSLLWLSGYWGPSIWERLEVDSLLRPGAVVLNIGVGLRFVCMLYQVVVAQYML